jgi:hypothetical protein
VLAAVIAVVARALLEAVPVLITLAQAKPKKIPVSKQEATTARERNYWARMEQFLRHLTKALASP